MSASSLSLAANSGEDDDIPVLRDDQNKISAFSRLDLRRKDCLAQIAALKEENRHLKDAIEEVTLCMEPNGLLLKVGESFLCGLDEMEISNFCEEKQQKGDEKLELAEAELQSIISEMEELKASLYARFGTKRINLEFS